MNKKILLYTFLMFVACVKMPEELKLEQVDFENPLSKTAVIDDPLSQDIIEGDSVVFTVSAIGNNLTFKWQKDLSDIDSSNDSSLTLYNLSRLDDSIVIRCIVSGDSGLDTSKNACLRILWPVKLLSNPVKKVVSTGRDASFSVTQTGSREITYNWFKNNVPISNSDSSKLLISNTTSEDSGSTYYCIVKNSLGADTSKSATLLVVSEHISPKIIIQPAHQQVVVNSNAKFSIETEGTDLNVNWYRIGVNEPVGFGPALVVYPATENHNGSQYYCTISNDLDTITSSNVLLSVYSGHTNPKIISSPDTIKLNIGEDTLITVEATGTELNYLWVLNDSVIKDTNDTRFIYFTDLSMSDSGSLLKCIAINPSGLDSTKSIPIIIKDTINKPIIITDLESKTYSIDQNAKFTIQATGKELSYKWYVDDILDSTYTDSTFMIPNLTLYDNGKKIQCIISNIKGDTPSKKVNLTVIDSILPVIITDHPQPAKIAKDSSASFSVTAEGSNLKYLWFKNNTALNNDTLHTISIHNATMSDSGSAYKCFIYNDSSSDTSNSATLSVIAPPQIDTNPQPIVVGLGANVTFSVSVSGSKPFQYIWLKDNDTISDETASTLSISSVTDSLDGTSYKCIVSNFAGVAISQNALLTVSLKPTISDPNSLFIKNGTNATFTVNANGGAGELLYQWQKETSNLETEVDSILTISSCTVDNDSGSIFRCIVEDSLGEKDTSKYAILNVLYPLSIDTQPMPQTIASNTNAVFHIGVSGSGPLNYQWFTNGDSVANNNSATLTFTNTNDSLSGTQVKCIVSTPVDTLTTNTVVLTVGNLPNVVTDLDSLAITKIGSSANFTVTATGGTGSITYKWFQDTSQISSGINDTNIVITSCSVDNDSGTIIKCIIEDSLGFIDSSKHCLLKVFDTVKITSHPTSIADAEEGQNATFSVTASGSRPFTYQWYRSGTAIPSANDSFFIESSLSYSQDNGKSYRCIIINEVDSTTSSSATLTVLPPYNPDSIAPSQIPPRGYTASDVPQFVCIGVDDNFVSGDDSTKNPIVIGERHTAMRWIHEYAKKKTNPNTSNNAATFDGSPVYLSFFSNTIGFNAHNSDYPNLLKWIHNEVFTYGHEVGNQTHAHLQNFNDTASATSWQNVINEFNSNISEPLPSNLKDAVDDLNTEGAGIATSNIFGFRAPFLIVTANMFQAVSNIGLKYDCSIEEGAYENQNASNYYWPYTLHDGLGHHYNPDINKITSSYPNIMEIPVYLLELVPDSLCANYGIPSGLKNKINAKMSWVTDKITGYDYNLWATFSAALNKDEVLAILKFNFDKRYNGNRAPLTLGIHSNYYTSSWDNSAENANWMQRQQAIEEFIDYVLQHSSARIVSHKQLYDWMRNPQKLQFR